MPAESVLDTPLEEVLSGRLPARLASELSLTCLLYTSDAADE